MSDDGKMLPIDLGMATAQSRIPQLPRYIGKDLNALPPKEMDAKIHKAATDFEALLLGQMVQSMWQTVPGGGVLSGSKEESMYRDMLTQEIAKTAAAGQGIGIRGVIERELTRQANKTEGRE